MDREEPVDEVLFSSTHAVRRCINCDHDDAQNVFTFTRDFLIDVRKAKPSDLDHIKFDESTRSTIVKCKQCGCVYIRDVFVADEQQFRQPWPEKKLGEALLRYRREFSRANVNHLKFENNVIDTLMRIVLRKNKSGELSLLDFGCSLGILPYMARIKGFDKVVAYDLKFPSNISELISGKHPLDVEFARRKADLFKHAPFDAIVCQAADEHFFDLQGELRLMHDLLSDHGVIYFSHPILNLDADIDDLRKEELITDKKRLRVLRKSYHINHLNYVMPKMFAGMLKKNGFREKKVLLLLQFMDICPFHPKNLMRLFKTIAKYLLDIFDIKYRKVVYFVEKDL